MLNEALKNPVVRSLVKDVVTRYRHIMLENGDIPKKVVGFELQFGEDNTDWEGLCTVTVPPEEVGANWRDRHENKQLVYAGINGSELSLSKLVYALDGLMTSGHRFSGVLVIDTDTTECWLHGRVAVELYYQASASSLNP